MNAEGGRENVVSLCRCKGKGKCLWCAIERALPHAPSLMDDRPWTVPSDTPDSPSIEVNVRASGGRHVRMVESDPDIVKRWEAVKRRMAEIQDRDAREAMDRARYLAWMAENYPPKLHVDYEALGYPETEVWHLDGWGLDLMLSKGTTVSVLESLGWAKRVEL